MSSTVVWLAGHAALLVAGHGWGDGSLSRSPALLVGLFKDSGVGDAWDHAYPGTKAPVPTVFWTIFGLLVAVATLGIAAAVARWTPDGPLTKGNPANWARGLHERKLAVAEWLVVSSVMTGGPRSKPWNARARKYLEGLLLAAHLKGASLRERCDWLYAGEQAHDQSTTILRSAGRRPSSGRPGEHAAAAEYGSTFQIHDEAKGSLHRDAPGRQLLATRRRHRRAAGDVDIDRLSSERGTLCTATPSGAGDRFTPYFARHLELDWPMRCAVV